MIKIAAIEDNDNDYSQLNRFLESYFKSIGETYTMVRFRDALSFFDNYKADYKIVFMDIKLPNLDGMESAKRLRKLDEQTCLVFVTNMAQYAVNGYEFNAFDFIVKPLKYPMFVIKMKRIMSYISKIEDVSIFVKTNVETYKIMVSKIRYVESLAHQIVYHLDDGTMLTSREALKSVSETLTEANGFFQINRCYLVNLKYVRKFSNDTVTLGDEELMISRPRKKEFLAFAAKYFTGGRP